MTLKATQSRLLRPLRLPTCLLVVLIGAFLFVFPVQAADTISAYVDADGRVVFVNESSQPKTSVPAPASTNSGPARKVLASTSRVAMAAATREAASDASGPLAAKTAASGSQDLDALIVQAASHHQIDPDLVRAIIQVESNFDPYAVSPAGARGLMQLIPSTAQRFGVANPFDPRANIDGGIRYLKQLLGMYEGNLQLTLAAYNAGENSVARFRGVPAYGETQDYIRKIGALYPIQNVPAGFRRAPKIMKFVDAAGVIHFSNTDLP